MVFLASQASHLFVTVSWLALPRALRSTLVYLKFSPPFVVFLASEAPAGLIPPCCPSALSPFRGLRCPELCDLPFFAFAFRVKHDPSRKVGPCFFCTGWRISHIDPPQGGFGKIKDLVFYPQHRFSWKCIANLHGIRLVCFVIAFEIFMKFAGLLPRIPCAGWSFVVTDCYS